LSKERARRREARQAELERERAACARRVARRARRRAVVRRLTPTPRRGRTGRLRRHSRGERAAIVLLTGAAVAGIWSFVDDLALRLALVVLLLLVLPAVVVIALDRR
jgi:Flp pilus assembly protein TadB